MASINGISTNATIFEDTLEKSTGNDSLGKEDFLKLLVAQLTHQDPTNPMQDTEFVAQLATYSGLEQQMTMNKNLETLIASQNLSTAASATSLIGAVVSYVDDDGNYQMGQVAFLDIVAGEINLIMNDANNTSVPYNRIQQVGYPFQQASSGDSVTESAGDGDTGDTE
jgi:flagellar basal-body rod modification protein FlgD